MKPNMIVTGAYGFIGSNFCNHLRGQMKKLVIIDSMTYASDENNISPSVLVDAFIKLDLSKMTNNDFDALIEYDAGIVDEPITIVHFAAESHVDNSIKGSKVFIDSNITGTHTILEYLKFRKNPNDKLVYVSTDEVLGSIDEGSFTEESPLAPNNPYSATKASAELLVRSYIITHKINACITRCCNNYGPNQADEKFIPTIIRCMIKRKPIPVYGNGKNIREWIYVKSHVDAIMDVATDGECGEIYNIGSGEELTNLEMINEIANNISSKIDKSQEELISLIEFVTDRPGHDTRYSINSCKIREELEWMPVVSLEDGLDKTVDYYISKFRGTLQNEKL